MASAEDLKRERANASATIVRLRKGRVTEAERARIRRLRLRIEAIDKELAAKEPKSMERSRPKAPKGTHDDKYEGVPITAKNARDMYIHYRRKVKSTTIFTKDRAYFERRLSVARDVLRKAGQKLPPPEPLFGKKKPLIKKGPNPYKKAPPPRDPYRKAPPPPRPALSPGMSRLPLVELQRMRAEQQRLAAQARARQDWAAMQRAENASGRLTQVINAKNMSEDPNASITSPEVQSDAPVTDTDVETDTAETEVEPWYKRYMFWLLGGAAAVGVAYASSKKGKKGGGITLMGGVPTRKGKRVRIVRPEFSR